MSSDDPSADARLDRILRKVVTERAFGDLEIHDALAYFCRTLSEALDVPRVSIWEFDGTGDALLSLMQWDSRAGLSTETSTLTASNAKSYLDAVKSDYAVVINDAASDPRCAELARDYLPLTQVSALLDCPIRTMRGLVGVVCIEAVGAARAWSTAEVSFAMAITGLVSVTIEHRERLEAESVARKHERRLEIYTDLATDWCWETDSDFRFEALHGNVARDGQKPGDYLGRKLWEMPLLSPHNSSWEQLRARIEGRKRIYDFVVAATHPTGEIHFAELAGIPKYAPDGSYAGYLGTAKDVTRRIRQELQLAESEQRYRNATRIAKLGSWVWDQLEDRCSYCSPELARIYGVAVEEYLDRTASTERDMEWFHPDDRAQYREVIGKAAREKTGYETVVRIVRDDGSIRTLHEMTEAVFGSSGRFIATAGVLRDITDQVELQEQLKTHQDRLKSVIDHIPGAVYRVRTDAGFPSIYRSASYYPLFVDPEVGRGDVPANGELPGLDIREGDRERVGKIVRRAVALNQPYEMEYAITLRDGSRRWVSDRGRPVLTADGSVELEGILIDETEKHAAQEALAHGQRLEAIGKLTGGIAHDFNNLLAVVLGNLEMLREEIGDSGQLEFLDAGIEAVHRGAELTRNMLAFARRTDLKLEILDLNEVARKAQKWIGRTLPENIAVEVSLMAGLWKVEADASAVESAILNLIINARDAMPGGGRLTIETSNIHIDDSYIEYRHEDVVPGRYVMIAVTDTGHGIPADKLDRIFEPFFTTKPPGAGSGLGLSMILGFMKQSGGTVRVYSEPNVGTTFKLYFRALAREVVSPISASTGALPDTHRGARILIVEDEKAILRLLERSLSKAGFDIQTAGTGDEALRIFQADTAFDLLITDIVMPGQLQGTTLSKRLREIKPELKVIFMSGYASEATIHGNGLRPEDIRLMKPVSRNDLIKAIEKILG